MKDLSNDVSFASFRRVTKKLRAFKDRRAREGRRSDDKASTRPAGDKATRPAIKLSTRPAGESSTPNQLLNSFLPHITPTIHDPNTGQSQKQKRAWRLNTTPRTLKTAHDQTLRMGSEKEGEVGENRPPPNIYKYSDPTTDDETKIYTKKRYEHLKLSVPETSISGTPILPLNKNYGGLIPSRDT